MYLSYMLSKYHLYTFSRDSTKYGVYPISSDFVKFHDEDASGSQIVNIES